MTITTRKLDNADYGRWQDLFQKYFDFYEIQSPKDGFQSVWDWVFDPVQEFWCEVAIDGDTQIVGFVHYQMWYNSMCAGKSCYMADLYVDPSVRGKGVGRKLIDHVRSFAKDNDLQSVDWLTQDFNYAGRQLYDTYEPKTNFVFYSIPV